MARILPAENTEGRRNSRPLFCVFRVFCGNAFPPAGFSISSTALPANLEAAGFVREISEAERHRVWCARALLDILEEPAQLQVWEPEPRPAAR